MCVSSARPKQEKQSENLPLYNNSACLFLPFCRPISWCKLFLSFSPQKARRGRGGRRCGVKFFLHSDADKKVVAYVSRWWLVHLKTSKGSPSSNHRQMKMLKPKWTFVMRIMGLQSGSSFPLWYWLYPSFFLFLKNVWDSIVSFFHSVDRGLKMGTLSYAPYFKTKVHQ